MLLHVRAAVAGRGAPAVVAEHQGEPGGISRRRLRLWGLPCGGWHSMLGVHGVHHGGLQPRQGGLQVPAEALQQILLPMAGLLQGPLCLRSKHSRREHAASTAGVSTQQAQSHGSLPQVTTFADHAITDPRTLSVLALHSIVLPISQAAACAQLHRQPAKPEQKDTSACGADASRPETAQQSVQAGCTAMAQARA